MQNELNELLTKAKELLKDEMTKISYETWIKNLEIQSADNGNIILLATSTFQKDAIEARYHDLLQNTFKYITNKIYHCKYCMLVGAIRLNAESNILPVPKKSVAFRVN